MKTLVSVLLGFFFLYRMPMASADTAHIQAVILDAETDEPIRECEVIGSFHMKSGIRIWTDPVPPNVARGKTDINGRCVLEGKTDEGRAGCWVTSPPPKGYYDSLKAGVFRYSRKDIFGVWQPDNLVATIKLQRVEHPIPLFLKQFADVASDSVLSDLFAIGHGSLQLDMVKGDWLPPVGRGERADVIFTRNPREEFGTGTNPRGITAPAYRDSMSVKFIGDDNGLVEVATPPTAGLKIRHAPEEGYRQVYVCWKERRKDLSRASNFDAKRNFAFRIRTERDESGRITSAYYGKIYGDICFKKLIGVGVEAVAAPCLLYYLNPAPNDRNLEWDMKNNLCPNPGRIGQRQP